MNILTVSELHNAVRIGMARAIAENGLTPSQAEAKLASMPIVKKADTPFLSAIFNAAKNWTWALAAGGAALGAYSGHLRHKTDQALRGDDDPEISTLRKKTDAYHKMKADLSQTQTAGLSA